MAMSRLLTIEETAERTRLSVNTLRWMRQRGDGPPSGKLGRRLFYREHEVEAWVNSQFGDFGDGAPTSSAG